MRRRFPEIITPVMQGNMGCFVACAAMVMGIGYGEAYELIHPVRAKRGWYWYHLGLGTSGRIKMYSREPAMLDGSLKPELAFKKLQRLGLKPRYVEVRNIKKLKQTAILWIRWEANPELMHSVVYDAKTKLFLDPMFLEPLGPTGKERLQRQLDSVVYLDSFRKSSR